MTVRSLLAASEDPSVPVVYELLLQALSKDCELSIVFEFVYSVDGTI